MEIDELDRLILQALQEDGRTPSLILPGWQASRRRRARNRYRALVEEGVVRTVGVVDPYVLGFQAPAIIGINVQPGTADRAARAIAALPEVSYLVLTVGAFDLIAEVFCRDLAHLTHLLLEQIHLIPGVRSTQTLMIARSYKLSYRWSPAPSEEPEAGEEQR